MEGSLESTSEFQTLDLALNKTENSLRNVESALSSAQQVVDSGQTTLAAAGAAVTNADTEADSANQAATTANAAAQLANAVAQRASTAATSCEAISTDVSGAITSQVNAQKGSAGGVAVLDSSGKVLAAQLPSYVPASRTAVGLPLSAGIALIQLIAAGFASGDSSGNGQNALKLGGIAAVNFPQISSGTWAPTISGGDDSRESNGIRK